MELFIFLFPIYKKSLAIAIIKVLLWMAPTLHNARLCGRLIQQGFNTISAKILLSWRPTFVLPMLVFL